jgi:multidrug transporter EmrE-like cation transporter
MNFIFIFSSILLAVPGQLLIKVGLNKMPTFSDIGILPFLLKAFTSIHVLAGLSLYFTSAIIWVMVLSKVQLSVAYPMLAFGYVLIVLFSFLILKEPITISKIVSIILIVIAIILLARN